MVAFCWEFHFKASVYIQIPDLEDQCWQSVWDERSNGEMRTQRFNHQSWSKYQFRLSVSISCQAEGVNIESESFNNCTQKVILTSLCFLAGLKKLRYLILAENRLFMGVIASVILPLAGRCVACVLASSIMYRYPSIELSHKLPISSFHTQPP